MMRPALSTVACPDWTLQRVAEAASDAGYVGIDLHTLGFASTAMACDPLLSGAAKVRSTLERAGQVPVCLSTTISLDDPITPPVLGLIRDNEASIRRARRVIEHASLLECPFVRVFPYRVDGPRRRPAARRWIVERIRLAADRCRNAGVRLLIENTGPCATAAALAQLLDAVDLPQLVGASYRVEVGQAGGDDPARAWEVLGDGLHLVRLADHSAGLPCPLGQGQLDANRLIDSLGSSGWSGWVVNQYDRLAHSGLDRLDEAIESGPRMVYRSLRSRGTPAVRGAEPVQL